MKNLLNKPSFVLITYLHSGCVLYKAHDEELSNIEYLFCEELNSKRIYGIRGWGTAYGTINDRLADLIINPELWDVIENYNLKEGYPYPWSTGYKTHQS